MCIYKEIFRKYGGYLPSVFHQVQPTCRFQCHACHLARMKKMMKDWTSELRLLIPWQYLGVISWRLEKMTNFKSDLTYSEIAIFLCICSPAQFMFECSHRTCEEPWSALDARFEEKACQVANFCKAHAMQCNIRMMMSKNFHRARMRSRSHMAVRSFQLEFISCSVHPMQSQWA